MHCPFCRNPDSRVIDSRTADGTAIRRRRSCTGCGRRFTTQETVILMVTKRSGVTEPFTRDKIIRGVRRACQGRPVDEDQLAILAQRAEDAIRARGCTEIPSHEVGLAILGPLRELDEVAYLRFASVYRGFQSLTDFEDEISLLRAANRSGERDSHERDQGDWAASAGGTPAVGGPAGLAIGGAAAGTAGGAKDGIAGLRDRMDQPAALANAQGYSPQPDTGWRGEESAAALNGAIKDPLGPERGTTT